MTNPQYFYSQGSLKYNELPFRVLIIVVIMQHFPNYDRQLVVKGFLTNKPDQKILARNLKNVFSIFFKVLKLILAFFGRLKILITNAQYFQSQGSLKYSELPFRVLIIVVIMQHFPNYDRQLVVKGFLTNKPDLKILARNLKNVSFIIFQF